jgi:hypothetical protein
MKWEIYFERERERDTKDSSYRKEEKSAGYYLANGWLVG